MRPRSQTSAASDRLRVDSDEQNELLPEHARVKSASVLDDYMDEEVVDRKTKPVGTLSCYWEAEDGSVAFCGVKANGDNGVRVVPGLGAQVSEHYSWVRLGYAANKVLTAPTYDCDQEVDVAFERSVYEHYGIEAAIPAGSLKYFGNH